MTTALYAGSFDPVHLGHVDIVEKAAACFEHVVVAVLANPRKPSGMFTATERLHLLRTATEHLANVTTTTFDGLTVDLARQVGAAVLVRAAHKEGRSEYQMAAINQDLAAIPTVFFAPSRDTAAISSSIIRTLAMNGRVDATLSLVPPTVGHALSDLGATQTVAAPQSPHDR
ncbi:MAG TPA: pantetheine-phosphate adenylyltransferase [Acidimicrobiales bacterium]|nr:pantetheine-phosphate adenylyltransferase [Acidimicrobiales bacterium]